MIELSLHSFLALDDEANLRDKLLHAEKCPFHDICPEMVGPHRKFANLMLNSSYADIAMHKMFPAAMLFPDINWTCFCKECAKKNPTPLKHNKFGYGFFSQYSWQAALRNWNSACMRAYKRIVKDNLNIIREE